MVDLDRTLPQNKHFRKENGGQGVRYVVTFVSLYVCFVAQLSHMKNILLAYSIHNPNLGYCQVIVDT